MPRKSRFDVSEEKIQRVVQFIKITGESDRITAARFGISHESVRKIKKNYYPESLKAEQMKIRKASAGSSVG